MKVYTFLLRTATLFLLVVTVLAKCDTNPLDPSSNMGGTEYQQWLSSLSPNQYEGNVYIPTTSNPCMGLAFHWRIDKESSKIYIAVAAQATGWVALGFSETGGMRGADIVYFEAISNQLIDSHVGDAYGKPQSDMIQDWKLNNSTITSDGFIIFEAERALFTNYGNEDHVLMDDSSVFVRDHIMIGAWGEGTISFHGKNVVKSSIQLFSSTESTGGDGLTLFREEMNERSDGHVILKLNNYKIPLDETTYHEVCFSGSDLLELGLFPDLSSPTYIIGLEYLVDPNTVKYAHHILLKGASTFSCNQWSTQILSGWTPGNDYLLFPENVGLKVGSDSYKSLSLEYHFDNIDGDNNKIDNETGVKIYYSNKPVEHELGMVVMGDGLVDLKNTKIGNGKSRHDFTCPSSCTQNYLGVNEVNVVAEGHHMHAKGKRMVTSVERDGIVINKAETNYWDFKQSGIGTVRQKTYKMKKGDQYHTTCYYESYEETKFGLASSEEMCMTFVYYYPKQDLFLYCGPNFFLPPCRSSYDTSILESDSIFDREMTQSRAPTNSPIIFRNAVPTSIPTKSPAHIPIQIPVNNPETETTNVPSASSNPPSSVSNTPTKHEETLFPSVNTDLQSTSAVVASKAFSFHTVAIFMLLLI